MAERTGGCACGAVRYRLLDDPLVVHCCHCSRCQRQTGSAFAVNALVEVDRVEASGAAPVVVEAPRGDDPPQRIHRCPACHVAVWSTYTRDDVLFVRAGTLDGPASVAPDVHIYTSSRLPWVAVPEGSPSYAAYYSTRDVWPPSSLARLDALRRGAGG